MDVTLEHQIQQVAQEIKDAHGSLDLLVNCSAMLHPSGRGETSLKQVQTEVCKTKSPFDVYFFPYGFMVSVHNDVQYKSPGC